MDVQVIEVIAQLVNQVGFPVLVAIYLIWRHETIIKQLQEKIEKLENAIVRLQYKIGDLKDVDNDNR